jgi:2-oxo-4-hydroxy-4-carboxy-5-ureidoimidazoline decarboxylase
MDGLSQLNQAPPDEVARQLGACCASPAWVAAMIAGRPYGDAGALAERGADALARLDWAQVRVALDAHPRIGARITATGTEAAWSRREQSGMGAASDDVRAALVEANRAYEDRFGHVFLIFATGRTDTEMLAAARERLDNPDELERTVVRTELARIVDLRLRRLAAESA